MRTPGSAGLPPGPSHVSAASCDARQEPGAPSTPRWHSRGYLPHRDEVGLLQFITYRLADSLPQTKLRELEAELALLPNEHQDPARRKATEKWLDAGAGCCALRHPRLAAVVQCTPCGNAGLAPSFPAFPALTRRPDDI